MQRRPVTSSNISSIGWDDDQMEVEFVSGHVYAYRDVPQSEYQALLGADSIGKSLNALKAKYQCTRVK
jgi:hypothetical protein